MQLGATVFIIPWTALYRFRVLFTPIIRSVINCTCSYWYNRVLVWCQIRSVTRSSEVGSVFIYIIKYIIKHIINYIIFSMCRRCVDTVKRTLYKFDICGSVHHHLIYKTTNVMQLGAIVFIILWTALYIFRVLFTPII
jgi:hypothetical protein